MLHANELVMLIIGIGTLLFILNNHHQLKRVPSSNILLGSFYLLVMGWFSTVMEGFLLESLLNYLEHFFYAASSILLAFWCWQTLYSKRNSSS